MTCEICKKRSEEQAASVLRTVEDAISRFEAATKGCTVHAEATDRLLSYLLGRADLSHWHIWKL